MLPRGQSIYVSGKTTDEFKMFTYKTKYMNVTKSNGDPLRSSSNLRDNHEKKIS